MGKLKSLAANLKREIRVYQMVLKDPRTPRLPKFLLGLAVGYCLMPFDLIPDFIPVIGQLDDAVIVPALIYLALRFIPGEIVAGCRAKVQSCQMA